MSLNIPNCKLVREHLVKLEEHQFIYWQFFSDSSLLTRFIYNREIPKCKTAACLAGWTLSVCGDQLSEETLSDTKISISKSAAILLGVATEEQVLGGKLTNEQYRDIEFLFFQNVGEAKKADAIRRLDYLIANDTMDGYDFGGESYCRQT